MLPFYTLEHLTLNTGFAFFVFYAVARGLAQMLPRHRDRLCTAAIWVPVVSILVLFFPFAFGLFVGFIAYKCAEEYRDILSKVYETNFSKEIADDSVLFKALSASIGLACCSGRLETILVTYGVSVGILVLIYSLKYEGQCRDVFLLDFFGISWSAFALSIGALTISVKCGPGFLILFLWLSWFGDAGAYFVGRKLGRTHCFPHISPNKTLEGCAAEVLFYVIITAILYRVRDVAWLQLPQFDLSTYMLLALLLSVLGILGDLVESLVKRIGDKKDSGNFFQGHGGCLDRFDSFLLASPVLYFAASTYFAAP